MRYQAIGTTDERNTCDCCGKAGLKRTVVLRDEDGEFVFYGTTCAARALGAQTRNRAQAEKAVTAAIAETREADRARVTAALKETADALAYYLGWGYTPSERWTAFSTWLRHSAPEVEKRSDDIVKNLLHRIRCLKAELA